MIKMIKKVSIVAIAGAVLLGTNIVRTTDDAPIVSKRREIPVYNDTDTERKIIVKSVVVDNAENEKAADVAPVIVAEQAEQAEDVTVTEEPEAVAEEPVITEEPVAEDTEIEELVYDDSTLILAGTEEESIDYAVPTNNGNVIVESGARADSLERVNRMTAYISAISGSFYDSGFTVTVKADHNMPVVGRSQYMGYTEVYGGSYAITISDDCIEEALVHEFGHYWDYTNGVLSNGAQFQQIYMAEATGSGLPNYFISTPQEFFAQIFQEAIVNPTGAVASRCPMAVAYINSIR